MKYNEVHSILRDLCIKQIKDTGILSGFSTDEIAKLLKMKRENASRELGKLLKDGLIEKREGRPVLYFVRNGNNVRVNAIVEKKTIETPNVFDNIVGRNSSLKHSIALAKAAIVYPPRGLHTLIVGETGVGKSFFAKCMFKYALEVNIIKNSNRFVVFNCADYSNNPQLLMGYLFGVKRGAYTGALEDREGIIERARDGILFLDEVHRLPPEGQEMLFTIIDEGRYTPLGSTREINIDVMIISATTENINSALLKTFSRRIPVTISLPPLRERTEEERLSLISHFFKEESKRIGKKIEIDNEAITALLNFECPNNIGELKSDIQIACAKAFLRSMFTDLTVKINLEDFSEKVRAGLLKAKKVTPSNFKVEAKAHGEYRAEEAGDKYSLSANIYEFIEERSQYLKSKGIGQDEIKLKVSNEVENFINSYLASIEGKQGEDDIKHIVSSELYDFLNNFMYLAEYRLKRKISRNTFLGLLVHIDAFLGRARERRLIENPKLDEIRKKYPEEFKLAMLLAEKLEQRYEVSVPLDEMGFITMFFAADVEENGGRVAVIVVMHGNSTASSMAEVVNQLLNTNHTIAFDMPLSMKPETALEKLKSIVKNYDEGMGALLLVDMGSLKYFDKLIKDETGIEVRAVDRVTTVMVLEATRKALMNQGIDDIIKSLDFDSRYLGNNVDDNIRSKKDVIITACSTGEGTAQKLKELIYTRYSKEQYEVINLSIKDREKFKKTALDIKKERNIKAIISPFDIKIQGIDYIPMDKFLKELMGEDLEANIRDEDLTKNIKIVYREYLELEDSEFIVNTFMELIYTIKCTFDIHLDSEKLNGLLMHFGCLIQSLINKEERDRCKNKEIILSRYRDLYDYIKNGVNCVEKRYGIELSEDDIANIVEILNNL
jgi:transcriptional regulator with AAA-type ATPase domain/transcriptional regulatory protein LevR